MTPRGLLYSALIGAVASARSMAPMACIAAARLLGYRTPGHLVALKRPLFTGGALAMGAGELLGDKMKTAPDRTVFLGLLAYLTLAARKDAMARIGQTRSGLMEDALVVALGVAVVALAVSSKGNC